MVPSRMRRIDRGSSKNYEVVLPSMPCYPWYRRERGGECTRQEEVTIRRCCVIGREFGTVSSAFVGSPSVE